ncbi:MAG: ankyrin repeat domain-containing protein [Alphaproteobacteria bacterium]|nr:ankyrin repeat domain-containing protein [Alphaproteobacteria bacterium]MBV9370692.1 ankyrin repeat domain-containing protein [Alphaproteobacteria bacterium]MBV9899895.1 ankyrin repeat domain-containing protein [Alphaproteobacteria bacterium]
MWGRAIAAAMGLALAATPLAAQHYSDGYTFIKAVKERDGTKVTELVSEPGTTVVNSKDRDTGEGALHIVTRGRDLTWLSFLLGKRANPNIQNVRGETPLSLAAQIGWLEGAELLVTHGGAVDLANGRGETPLIMAVHARDIAMVRLLLSRGANPKKTDNAAGYSAIDYARQDNRAQPILKLLEAAQAPRPAVGPKL